MSQRFLESTTGGLMRLLASEYGIAYGTRTEPDLVLPAAALPQLRFAQPLGAPASPGGD